MSISINCHLSVNLVLAVPLHFIALWGQPASNFYWNITAYIMNAALQPAFLKVLMGA